MTRRRRRHTQLLVALGTLLTLGHAAAREGVEGLHHVLLTVAQVGAQGEEDGGARAHRTFSRIGPSVPEA